MAYVVLYISGILCIWWVYSAGWRNALKKSISILIPSALIILLNMKAGRLLFKSPIVGIISILPSTIFIYRGSLPLVDRIHYWIKNTTNNYVESQNVVDAEVISKEDL